MNYLNLEVILLVVTILGGVVALVLAVFQLVDTYLDIGEKLKKRRLKNTNKTAPSE